MRRLRDYEKLPGDDLDEDDGEYAGSADEATPVRVEEEVEEELDQDGDLLSESNSSANVERPSPISGASGGPTTNTGNATPTTYSSNMGYSLFDCCISPHYTHSRTHIHKFSSALCL